MTAADQTELIPSMLDNNAGDEIVERIAWLGQEDRTSLFQRAEEILKYETVAAVDTEIGQLSAELAQLKEALRRIDFDGPLHQWNHVSITTYKAREITSEFASHYGLNIDRILMVDETVVDTLKEAFVALLHRIDSDPGDSVLDRFRSSMYTFVQRDRIDPLVVYLASRKAISATFHHAKGEYIVEISNLKEQAQAIHRAALRVYQTITTLQSFKERLY